jgi:hypothetical protein
MKTYAFFDSNGAVWLTCHYRHPDAQAFGPIGTSRPALPSELVWNGLLDVSGKWTPWEMAGCPTEVRDDGWTYTPWSNEPYHYGKGHPLNILYKSKFLRDLTWDFKDRP